ncbi:MAG: hypothetical protein WD272_06045 [Balneolales bacterium]
MTYSPLFIKISFYVLLIVFFFETANAQQASRRIDRDTVRTGDVFMYHLRITDADEYDDIRYPDSTQFGYDFVIRDRKIDSDEQGVSLVYTLQYFGVDDQFVPELYAGLVDGADTTFLVIPELPFIYEARVEDPDSALRPLKPIFQFPRNWWPWILSAIALLLLAGYLLYRYRDQIYSRFHPPEKPKIEPVPFYDPLKNLRRELDRIEDTYPDPHKSYREFYTELGDVFRIYFEEVHLFPALESTTGEVIKELKSRPCDTEVIRLLASLLQEADLVKFAKYKPNEKECRSVMKNSSILTERIAITDRPKIDLLRSEHEERQIQLTDTNTL